MVAGGYNAIVSGCTLKKFYTENGICLNILLYSWYWLLKWFYVESSQELSLSNFVWNFFVSANYYQQFSLYPK